jgi:two-component system, cell cycle response regulator DivK
MARAISVLLVESTVDDRAMYAEYLRVCGFEPIECDTTDEALERASHADVVVTGIRVNGPFDGIELVSRLRADGATRDKPVIVLTACALEPDRQRAEAVGCDAFLPKPCLPETLATEIRRTAALSAAGRRRSHGLRARAAKARLKSADQQTRTFDLLKPFRRRK